MAHLPFTNGVDLANLKTEGALLAQAPNRLHFSSPHGEQRTRESITGLIKKTIQGHLWGPIPPFSTKHQYES